MLNVDLCNVIIFFAYAIIIVSIKGLKLELWGCKVWGLGVMGAHCKTTILGVKIISQGILFIDISHVV
jgi:hypothetical protein